MRWPPAGTMLLILLMGVPASLASMPLDGGLDSTDVRPLAAEASPDPWTPAPASPERAPSPEYWIPGTRLMDGAIRIEPGVAWKQHGQAAEARYVCPDLGGSELPDPRDDPNVMVLRAQCPFRIIDDADLLGSPRLAVDPTDPNKVAFFSLHGGSTSDGPTPRSRDPDTAVVAGGLTHTTFTSTNQGWDWEDNPHGDGAYGEANDGLVSRDGNLFIMSLFSKPLGAQEDGTRIFDYHFELYKENSIDKNPGHRGKRIPARMPGNVIEEVSLVLVTPPTRIETQAEYESYMENRTEQGENATAPSDDDDIGNHTIPRDAEDTSDDLVAAVWFERAYDWRNATTGKSSWIDMVVTDASSRDDWDKIDDSQLIGPCRSASNAVGWNGRIYVACSVDAGYTGRHGARIGDIDIWQLDPVTGNKSWMSVVPGVVDGQLRLAANEEGRFALTVTNLIGVDEGVGTPDLRIVWGWHGRTWRDNFQIGHQFHDIWDQPLVDGRVTAIRILDNAPVAFVSFMERSNTTANPQPPGPNGAPEASAIEFHKAVGLFSQCSGMPESLFDLQTGIARHPFEDGLVGDQTGVFDDLHDGMDVVFDPSTGQDRLYFAYGDHGVIQYGILDVSGVFPSCTADLFPPPLFTPAPPIAAPLMLSNAAGVATGLAAAVPAAVGLGSLLIAKRKVALAAAVKARK